jgi:hypothetical protein
LGLRIRAWDEAAIITVDGVIFTATQDSTGSSKQFSSKSVLVFLFGTEGIMHMEFVPLGQTVSGNFYCNVLRRLKVNRREQTSSPVAQQFLGPAQWKRARPQFTFCAAAFYFKASLLTWPRSLWFSLFPEMKVKLKGEAETLKEWKSTDIYIRY